VNGGASVDAADAPNGGASPNAGAEAVAVGPPNTAGRLVVSPTGEFEKVSGGAPETVSSISERPPTVVPLERITIPRSFSSAARSSAETVKSGGFLQSMKAPKVARHRRTKIAVPLTVLLR